MNEAGISVSELNQLISESLRREPRLRFVTVTAEVSGFKSHFASGHWYFSLKDAEAAVNCVMFRQHNVRTTVKPKDGDLVTVSGSVELYVRDGRLQLYVQEMRPAGQGGLREQYEALLRKLDGEGLFDQARKKPIPRVPRKVAVITSASGAALHDILNVSGQRSPAIPIVVVPSSVQGAGAAAELVKALNRAQRIPQVDTIILARGGGSAEDLWCFNDEALARAIADCPIPVVTGVGHEVDTSICDYAADFRASTPSNAAEVVFPDRGELREQTRYLRTALSREMNGKLHAAQMRMMEARGRLQRNAPDRRIQTLLERTAQQQARLGNAMSLRTRGLEETLRQERVRLRFSMNGTLQRREAVLQQLSARLNAISPLKVLDRGYALVYDGEERVLPDAKSAAQAKEYQIRFRDGKVGAFRKE